MWLQSTWNVAMQLSKGIFFYWFKLKQLYALVATVLESTVLQPEQGQIPSRANERAGSVVPRPLHKAIQGDRASGHRAHRHLSSGREKPVTAPRVTLSSCNITGTQYGLHKGGTHTPTNFLHSHDAGSWVGTPSPLCSPSLPEPVERLDDLLARQMPRDDHKPPELENPGMELVIHFGLVLSFRTCYYDKHIQVGNPLKKKTATTSPSPHL